MGLRELFAWLRDSPFLRCRRLCRCFVNGQLELLGLLEMSADHFARVSSISEETGLFIDRLWRCLLAEPVLLVAENRNVGYVGDDLRAEKTADVSERILGKTRRPVAEA